MRQLFKSLNLGNFNEQDIIKTLTEDLNKSEVSLTFRWTNKRNILFYKLQLIQNGKLINLLNGASLNESSGTYTFHVGSFQSNEELEISYGLLPLVSIPKLIVILTQTNPTIAFQASPKDPGTTNKVESGIRFTEIIKYKVQ